MSASLVTQLLLVILVTSWEVGNGCVLCPLQIPAKPKPLDQFRLPSIQKLIDTSDSITRLCHNNSRLNNVQESCRAEVSHLFCSLTSLLDNFKRECPSGADGIAEECAKCQRENAATYKRNAWILTWLDAIGKMPSGISDGNYHWLGDYEQCQQLKNAQVFNGRYCLLEFQIPDAVLKNQQCESYDPLEVRLGICLPAGCTVSEVKELVEYVADHEVDAHCEPPQQWSLASTIFLYSIIGWVCVIIGATALRFFCCNTTINGSASASNGEYTAVSAGAPEETRLDSMSTLSKILLAVSLQRNVRDSLRTTRRHSSDYHSVQGLQVVLTVLMIVGNLLFLVMPYLENVGYFYRLFEEPLTQPLINSSFYIDSLIALSAFLFALKPKKHFEGAPALLWGAFKRFIRIWLTYAFITLFVSFLYIRLGEGPMWSNNDLAQRCGRSWWLNLLLVNNLFGYTETCLDGGFLVALEAQFYVVGFAVMFLAATVTDRRKSVIHALVWAGVAASVLYTFAVSFFHCTVETLIPPLSAPSAQRGETYANFVNKIYLNPLARIAPFLLAIAMPTHFRRLPAFNKPMFQPPIALLCVFIATYVVWTPYLLPYDDIVDGRPLARLLSALYCATHRPLWAFVVLYLAHLLNNRDPKNSLNAILGWRILHPLSKLVYLVFLLSEPVALSLFASLHRPIYATPLSTLLTAVGTLVCSYIIAFLVDILYTRPIVNLVTKAWRA